MNLYDLREIAAATALMYSGMPVSNVWTEWRTANYLAGIAAELHRAGLIRLETHDYLKGFAAQITTGYGHISQGMNQPQSIVEAFREYVLTQEFAARLTERRSEPPAYVSVAFTPQGMT